MPWALLAAPGQPTDDDQPTDAETQLALNEHTNSPFHCSDKASPCPPHPFRSLCGDQKKKKALQSRA